MFDLAKIKRAHQRFLAEHSRAVSDVINSEKLTALEQGYVLDHGGFRNRTGNLVRKTKVKVVRTGKGRLLVKSQNASKYAAAQDLGSGLYGPKRRKYLILPKKPGGVLAFKVRGKMVFARRVMHPGVRPTRFLYNANDAAFRTCRVWLLEAMKLAAHKF